MTEAFSRSAALLGAEAMSRLGAAHVLIVGVGGVGSWCAEALVRTGLGSITLVDDDVVAVSNLNRQCPATVSSVGTTKVEAMRARLLAINPSAVVNAVAARYPTEAMADLARYDFVVDAIDSVAEKVELIRSATAAGVPFVSSMGAALRLDPTRVRISRFDKVAGDGLARALRQRFRREGGVRADRFDCVWSDEPPQACVERGSLMPVTAAFGMALASRVLKGVCG